MKITEIRIRKIESTSNIIASASILLDDCFLINKIKIIKGDNGLFVGMPSVKDDENSYHDIAHPINLKTKEYIQNAILEAYNKLED